MEKMIVLKILAFRIEWHWLFIMMARRKGIRMLNDGMLFSDPRLLRLNRRLTRRCIKVMRVQKDYEDICGLTAMLAENRRWDQPIEMCVGK